MSELYELLTFEAFGQRYPELTSRHQILPGRGVFCKAERLQSGVIGTYAMPQRMAPTGEKHLFGYYLTEKKLLLVEKGGFLQGLLPGLPGETPAQLLSELLAPEQYETDIATIPGSKNRVEFAVRLPGEGAEPVYLPIDSKFHGEAYAQLQDAYEHGDPAAVKVAREVLVSRLKQSAKDIRDKYVEPPYTTSFGILFVPFEGLYAEAVSLGMVEILQQQYQINLAGPSTMAALLNALQMGFHTLAIQKRSNEIWQVLGAVKTEFLRFEDILAATQKHAAGFH